MNIDFLLTAISGLAIRATVWLAVVLIVARWAGSRRPLLGSALSQVGLVGLLLLPVSA